MAKNYYCLAIFPFILTFLAAEPTVAVYDRVAYTAFNPPGEEGELVFHSLDEYSYDEPSRVRRDVYTTEAVPDKTRPTKKPSGLDNKQSTILADGAINKTTKYSPKEPKLESDHDAPAENSGISTSSTPRAWQKASGPVLLNVTLPDRDEIQITRFLEDDISNKTLKENNITSQQEDHHVYYNSSLMPGRGKEFWVDMENTPGVKVSEILSTAHRRAVTVKLSFEFPFYGHLIRNMTIATGGFLYTGEYVHAWLAATQYIAPLMANFDTSINNHSYVKYVDNGTAFTVQWENVVLQENPNEGSFTFQCTLHDTGDIIFTYRNVALFIDQIEEHQHPVKVGLSDAYIIDRTIFFVRRKTIYEYHRVDFKREDIRNWTAIVLTALDTCLDMKSCRSCVSELPRFQCNWCSGRCSNGVDRHRQDWLHRGCDNAKLHSEDTCPVPPSYQPSSAAVNFDAEAEETFGIAGVLGIMLTLAVLLCVGAWILYAYRNPHSASGQFLIRYRPSTWTWRRGEARYTAATIHM